MARVTPAIPRFQVDEDQNGYQIRIPMRRNWFMVAFLLLWLGGWTFGELSVIDTLLKGKAHGGPVLFLLFWLGGWTLGGAWALYTAASMLIGREIVVVNGPELAVKTQVGSWTRSKEFDLATVQNLRVSVATYNNGRFSPQVPWLGNVGNVAFDYGAKTYRFGTGLEEAEAQAIVDALQQRCPQLRAQKSSFYKL